MSVGLRVLRGPDWPGDDDRDGGEGHVGTVVSVGGEGTCEVLWDNGLRSLCRIGKLGKHDLRILDNATVGVRHPQIICDGCYTKGLSGMLWKCNQCKQCNLCSLCYVSDKHDLSHEFIRFDTPTSDGSKVKRRSSSLKIRALGLFPGATVLSGADWNSGNMDGDTYGQLISIVNNPSQPSTRNMVKVLWSSGQQGDHRVGYQGKVDIKYKEESQGTYYYKEHLPCLKSDDTQYSRAREVEVLQEGDMVCIQVTAISLKEMQNARSGWTSGMANCIGKIGVIKAFTQSGDATVEFGGLRFRFVPEALKKVPTLKVGTVVEVEADELKLRTLLEGHLEWTPDMKQVLGKCGKVVKVGENGNVVLGFGERTVLLFAACCKISRDKQVHSLEAPSSSLSSTTSSLGAHGDLLKLMAEMVMKERDKMASDPDLLYQAIGKGDVGMVKSIVTKLPTMANVSHKGVTPLILAAHEGQTAIVQALLERSAQTSPTDGKGHTALHAALIGRKERTARLLLENGASVQSANNQQRTALHFAAHANLYNIMPDLIRYGCPVNARDIAGDTPLHDAITKGNNEAVSIMLRAAKIDLSVSNSRDFNALHLSCFTGNAFSTEAILKRDPAMVNLQKQGDKFAALHIAAINDHVDCARILLDMGKADVNIRSFNLYTPLHLSCNEAHYRTAELLLEKGADPNQKDEDGDTALHVTIGGQSQRAKGDREHLLLAALLGLSTGNDDETRVKIACLLLQKNAILDAKNKRGITPLEGARSQTVRQAVQMFVRRHESSIKSGGVSFPREQIQIRLGGTGPLDLVLPCARCTKEMSQVTVHPCGHKVLCRECCLLVSVCPLCDKTIDRRTVKKRADPEDPCKVQ